MDESKILDRKEVYEIVNCALEVSNTMGHGLHEKPYENAPAVDLEERGIPYLQQEQHPLKIKTIRVSSRPFAVPHQ